MNTKQKIYATLVCAMFVGAALPSVSAASTIGTLSTVDDKNVNILLERNNTAGDITEMIGLSLDETDTFYVSYYNTTGTMLHTSFSAYEDNDSVVWFNVSITDMNATNRKCYFDDETISDSNYDETSPALYINSTVNDETMAFVVTIPSDVTFEYDDYGFKYDSENITVLDDDGDEIDNLSSYVYDNTTGIYTMNLSDSTSSHQIVIVTDEIHDSATAATGKRVTKNPWYWLASTTPFTMNTESTTNYDMFTMSGGYLAFNVYNDYSGMLAKYVGGKTGFRMTNNSFMYEKPKWLGLSSTMTTISTREVEMSGITMGIIERMYVEEGSGSDNDEVIFENYGVVCSKGVSTSVSGLDILTMMTTRTPAAKVDTGKASFA